MAQAFKKQFSSQKNAYYAQVEALNLSKKDNETVRHFALKVQQLVAKGWCNENASTINLKCNVDDENSRYFSVPFAVADIKYNILGTPFFEDNIQNINIQDFTLEFKYKSKTHPNYAKFTTLLSKDYPYFSYIYRINSKTQIRLKPKSSKIAHFPIKNYHNLHFTTTPQIHFFPSVPHTYFAT